MPELLDAMRSVVRSPSRKAPKAVSIFAAAERIPSACARIARPAGVSVSPRASRTKSVVPRAPSSFLSRRLTAEVVRCTSSAAAGMLSVRASARKIWRSVRS